jgi:negative regulator of sigma E activity
MNEALKMQISAFVDGELPDNESELLLRRLSQDAAMRQQVAEFLEIGRLMRRDQEVPGMDTLRGRIAVALGEDDTLVAEPEKPAAAGSSLMTPASGIAVAATVAALALIGLSQLTGPVDAGLQDAVAIDLAPAYTEPTAEQVLMNQPSERLLDYVRRHGDSSPDMGSSDIIYRMATFEISAEHVEIPPDPHLMPAEDVAATDDDGVQAAASDEEQAQ